MVSVVLMGLIVCAPAHAAEVVDRIVAVVNGNLITLSEVDKKVAQYALMQGRESDLINPERFKQMQHEVLEVLIDDLLLFAKAETFEISVGESEIDDYLNNFRDQNHMSKEQFMEMLRQNKMEYQEYRDTVRQNIMKQRLLGVMVSRKAVVTDGEIREYYDKHGGEVDSFSTTPVSDSGDAKKVEFIVVDTQDQANNLKAKIESGDISFGAAAKKHSVGPGADDGGNLGVMNFNDLAAELKGAIESTPEGKISAPFSIAGKYGLVRASAVGASTSASESAASSEKSGADEDFELAKEQIRQVLLEEKYNKLYREYLDRLRNEAVIDMRF